MQFKLIDSKMKEIYYDSAPIKEEEELAESRYNFWNTMNLMAIQNKSFQQIKTSYLL